MFVSIALFESMIFFDEWTIVVLGDIIGQDKPCRAIVLLHLTNSYWQIRHPQPSSVEQHFEFIVLPLLPQTHLLSDSLSFTLKHTSLLGKKSLYQPKVVCLSPCLMLSYITWPNWKMLRWLKKYNAFWVKLLGISYTVMWKRKYTLFEFYGFTYQYNKKNHMVFSRS